MWNTESAEAVPSLHVSAVELNQELRISFPKTSTPSAVALFACRVAGNMASAGNFGLGEWILVLDAAPLHSNSSA